MHFLSSLRDSFCLSNLPHDLRRGLHSFAASRLVSLDLDPSPSSRLALLATRDSGLTTTTE